MGAELVDVAEGKTAKVIVKIGAPGSVRGRARTFPDGTGVAGLVCHTPRGSPVRSDRDGRFELPGVNPGRVQVACRVTTASEPGPGTPFGVATVEVAAGAQAAVDVWVVSLPEKPANLGMELDTRGAQLVVRSIVSSGPAASAGLRVGDEILAIDGGPAVGNAFVAGTYLMSRPAGASMALRLRRAGREFATTLTVGASRVD